MIIYFLESKRYYQSDDKFKINLDMRPERSIKEAREVISRCSKENVFRIVPFERKGIIP